MHWHGWFRRRVLLFTCVFRYALAWLVQKEGVTIYICVSACTGMVDSEGGCYYLHMFFGMHWDGWFRRRVLPFTYMFRYALAWLVQKEGVTIYICVSACTGMVGSEGGCYHLHMCFGMHWHGWFSRRVLPFTFVFRYALAWLVQKEDVTFTCVFRYALVWLVQKKGVTIYMCVSVCTGMVGSEGGCYHLHVCFGMHWHG
jgi:sulfur relay (sulfurtransferase) complex TusBCD TusD component (DsrE family)